MSAVFQLVAGSLPLDFVNTLDNRGRANEIELLASYSDLVAFLLKYGAITETLARKLSNRAQREPRKAQAVLHRAHHLRESLNRVVIAIAHGDTPPADDMQVLNAEATSAAQSTSLQKQGDAFKWTWSAEPDALERALWLIVRAATDLLTSGNLDRIRLCEAETCQWAFLDTSRNRSRRWCDMKICGNREKVRRFYDRQKES